MSLVNRIFQRRLTGGQGDLYVANGPAGVGSSSGHQVDTWRWNPSRSCLDPVHRVTGDILGTADAQPDIASLRQVRAKTPTTADAVLTILQNVIDGADRSHLSAMQRAIELHCPAGKFRFDEFLRKASKEEDRLRGIELCRSRILMASIAGTARAIPVPVDMHGGPMRITASDHPHATLLNEVVSALGSSPSTELTEVVRASRAEIRVRSTPAKLAAFTDDNGIRYDRVAGLPNEDAVFEQAIGLAKQSFSAAAIAESGSDGWLTGFLRQTADRRTSWVARSTDGTVVGAYLTRPDDVRNHVPGYVAGVDGLSGIEGVALVTAPEHRGEGIGRTLRAIPEQDGWDYVFGTAMAELGNQEHWKRVRDVIHEGPAGLITMKVFAPLHDLKNEAVI